MGWSLGIGFWDGSIGKTTFTFYTSGPFGIFATRLFYFVVIFLNKANWHLALLTRSFAQQFLFLKVAFGVRDHRSSQVQAFVKEDKLRKIYLPATMNTFAGWHPSATNSGDKGQAVASASALLLLQTRAPTSIASTQTRKDDNIGGRRLRNQWV